MSYFRTLSTFHFKFIRRSCYRRLSYLIAFCIVILIIKRLREPSEKQLHNYPLRNINENSSKEQHECHFKPSTDAFILNYELNIQSNRQSDPTRVEPSVERIQKLLEIIRSKEDKYQPLLERFNVFTMIDANQTLKEYSDESNIDEIKMLYNRYIRLMSNKRTIQIHPSFIDYLRRISAYLSDGLRNKRKNQFQVTCLRKPVFVLACDELFFDILQGALRTLDAYWPHHRIVFYDMGLSNKQIELLKEKCRQCQIIKFPFSLIERYAAHIRLLTTYAFKPFVIQDALRRFGTIIYGDSSSRFNSNSFDPVLIDNYIRGFAARELPGHLLSCFTRTGTFTWFNQSSVQYDGIYMAEANFLVVTDTLVTRLIMKAWLTCALEHDCLVADGTRTICTKSDFDSDIHRYDQSVMVILLTYFFYQNDKAAWTESKLNDPAPYDMFTSVQRNLGDIRRGEIESDYLSKKKFS